jgi:hypothetical protein
MENPDNSNGNTIVILRKFYSKPVLELVPLFPKQTVLGTGCFSSSLNTGEKTDEIYLGCGLGGCLLP